MFAGLDEQLYGFLSTSLHPNVHAAYHAISIDERRSEFAPTLWDAPSTAGQEIDQVWFASAHGEWVAAMAKPGSRMSRSAG